MLYVNFIGKFENALMIGKSEKPRCFKNLDIKHLYVYSKTIKKCG